MKGLEIFQILETLDRDQYTSSKRLAEKLNIGEKTLRGRISEINGQMPQEIGRIEMKRGAGYRLSVTSSQDLAAWKQELMDQEKSGLPSSTAERVDYLLLLFLNNKDYIKKESLCDFLYVSEKTISQDLKKAEFILRQFGIGLEKKAHHGMRAQGGEFAKRQCIMNSCMSGKSHLLAESDREQERLGQIRKIVLDTVKEEKLLFSEIVIKHLIDYIYITEHRVRHGFLIEAEKMPETEISLLAAAEKFLLRLKEAGCEVSTAKNEIAFLAVYLQGNRMFDYDLNGTSNLVITEETMQLAEQMLESIYMAYMIDLRDNFHLCMNIYKHLTAMELRLQYGIEVKNPVLEEVKEKYLFSFMLAQQACVPIAEKYKKTISEDEVSYIAMLLELEQGEKKEAPDKKKILLVCATGRTSANFLLLMLSKKFADYIDQIELCSLYELDQQDLDRYDGIFTTVPINRTVHLPVVMIHDFLSQSETLMIKEELNYMKKSLIEKFYKEEFFFTELQGETREEVLKEMCDRVQKIRPLPDNFYPSVLCREELGSTDFGNLTAIPHPMEPVLSENLVCVGILKKPILWHNNQVQLVILSALSEGMSQDVEQYFEVTLNLIGQEKLVKEIIKEKEFRILYQALNAVFHSGQKDN